MLPEARHCSMGTTVQTPIRLVGKALRAMPVNERATPAFASAYP